jgi:hypothetical protein
VLIRSLRDERQGTLLGDTAVSWLQIPVMAAHQR